MFRRAVHPGVILKDELTELGVSPDEFARRIDVPPNHIGQIIAGKRPIADDTALRFGQWFGVEPQFWLNLQTQFDLAAAHPPTRCAASRRHDRSAAQRPPLQSSPAAAES